MAIALKRAPKFELYHSSLSGFMNSCIFKDAIFCQELFPGNGLRLFVCLSVGFFISFSVYLFVLLFICCCDDAATAKVFPAPVLDLSAFDQETFHQKTTKTS